MIPVCAEHFPYSLLSRCSQAAQDQERQRTEVQNQELCSDHVSESVIRETLELRSMETNTETKHTTNSTTDRCSNGNEEHNLKHGLEHNFNTSATHGCGEQGGDARGEEPWTGNHGRKWGLVMTTGTTARGTTPMLALMCGRRAKVAYGDNNHSSNAHGNVSLKTKNHDSKCAWRRARSGATGGKDVRGGEKPLSNDHGRDQLVEKSPDADRDHPWTSFHESEITWSKNA